ncbi:hypothetical protein, partial [Castellaniella sp.]|uniref:hypothetical protein n=1 Tax=Castellaniella sp. TaxID=1955812 RepID=UPI002AFEF4FE
MSSLLGMRACSFIEEVDREFITLRPPRPAPCRLAPARRGKAQAAAVFFTVSRARLHAAEEACYSLVSSPPG